MYIIQYIYIRTYLLHLMTCIDILPGGACVGMGAIADDVAIWCTLRNEYMLNYVWIDNYVHSVYVIL